MARLVMQAETRADDGMELFRVETFQAATPDQLPHRRRSTAKAEKMASDLKALRAAPLADPFDGPAGCFLVAPAGRIFPRSAGAPPRRAPPALARRGPNVYEEGWRTSAGLPS